MMNLEMTAQPEKKKYTPSEYLALEEKAETKSEYWNGEIVAMSGAKIDHQQITMNISRVLGNKLYGKCRVFASEMKVWVKKRNKFFYPDITIIRDKPNFYKNRRDTIDNPKIIIEVLSKSTASFDRAEKFLSYQTLVSLEEYVLISQERAAVEQYIKREDGNWIFQATIGLESSVKFTSIKTALSLQEIYDLVEFEEENI
ncbi:MAG TPA: Uma2 family endonuclease [Pyrinomonadaceae bacterium]|nr:Uma2 family endonuclease [Pyrinomonadaceae bacterium]